MPSDEKMERVVRRSALSTAVAGSLIGIFVGKQLTRFIPLAHIHRGAGTLFLVFGAVILYQALAG